MPPFFLPRSLGVGAELSESAPRLQDAQGEHIRVRGYKNVCFCFRTEQGKEVEIHEKAHFAEGINQPIISFGKMMEAGWGIDGEDRVLTYGGGPHQIRIPLKLQNRSLIAEGFVWAIQTVPYVVRVLGGQVDEGAGGEGHALRVAGQDLETGGLGVHLGKKAPNSQYSIPCGDRLTPK